MSGGGGRGGEGVGWVCGGTGLRVLSLGGLDFCLSGEFEVLGLDGDWLEFQIGMEFPVILVGLEFRRFTGDLGLFLGSIARATTNCSFIFSDPTPTNN